MSGTRDPEGEKSDCAEEPPVSNDEWEEFNLDDIEVIESKVFG
jgi:hypothetical protein